MAYETEHTCENKEREREGGRERSFIRDEERRERAVGWRVAGWRKRKGRQRNRKREQEKGRKG